jgi:hypothetical protein
MTKNTSQWGKETAAKRYAFGGAPSFGQPIGGNTAQSQRMGQGMGAAGARDISFGTPYVDNPISGAPSMAGNDPTQLGQQQRPVMGQPPHADWSNLNQAQIDRNMATRAARQAERMNMRGQQPSGPVAAFKRGGTPKKGK